MNLIKKFYQNFPNSTNLKKIKTQEINSLIKQKMFKQVLLILDKQKESNDIHYKKAFVFYKLGQFNKALNSINKLKSTQEIQQHEFILKIKILEQLDQKEELANTLKIQKFDKLNPKGKIAFLLAKIFLSNKDDNKEKLLKTIIADFKQFANEKDYLLAIEQLSNIYLTKRDFKSARQLWQSFFTAYPSYVPIKLADIDYIQKKLDKALSQYINTLNNSSDSSNKSYLQEKIITIHTEKREFADLENFIEKVFIENSIEENINILPSLFIFYEEQNSLKKVKLKIDSLIKKTSSQFQKEILLFFKGLFYYLEKDNTKAISLFNQTVNKRTINSIPMSNSFLVNLADFFLQYGNTKKSTIIIDSQPKLTPKLLMMKIQILLKERKLKEAKILINQLNGKVDKVMQKELDSFLVEFYYFNQQFNEALSLIEFSKKTPTHNNNSTRIRLNYYLGTILYNEQKYKESLKFLTRIFTLFPQNYYTADSLLKSIQIYNKLGELEKAKKLSKEITEKFPLFSSQVFVRNYLKKFNLILD